MKFEYGFLILSPEGNINKVKSTLSSISLHYNNIPSICIANTDNLSEFNKLCPTYKGNNNQISSMINVGMKNSTNKWNILLTEGVWISKNIDKKLSTFAKSESEVLYPIYAQYDMAGRVSRVCTDFTNAPINGITIHRSAFMNVGNFSENPTKISKQLWHKDAIKKGITFKGILGVRIV